MYNLHCHRSYNIIVKFNAATEELFLSNIQCKTVDQYHLISMILISENAEFNC